MKTKNVFPVVFADAVLVGGEKCFLEKERKGKRKMCLKPCAEGAARRDLFFSRAFELLSPDAAIQLILEMVQALEGELTLRRMAVNTGMFAKFLQQYPISKFDGFDDDKVFRAGRGFAQMFKDDRLDSFGYAYPQAIQNSLVSCAHRPVIQVKLAKRPLGMEFTSLLSIATFLLETETVVLRAQVESWVAYPNSRYSLVERKVLFAFLCLFLLSQQKGECPNRVTILEFVESSGLLG